MNEIIDNSKTVLEIRDLTVDFISESGISTAVENLRMSIREGESLGIVGESGSGKTVTALSILKLLQSPPGIYRNGSITFRSKILGEVGQPAHLRTLLTG